MSMNMDVGPLVLLAPQGVAEPEERMPAGYVPMGVPAGAQTVPHERATCERLRSSESYVVNYGKSKMNLLIQ